MVYKLQQATKMLIRKYCRPDTSVFLSKTTSCSNTMLRFLYLLGLNDSK